MHRSTVELLDHLYGIAGADEHLAKCAECQQQLEKMRTVQRGQVEAQPAIPVEFLAAQRRRIWDRIEKPASWRPRLMQPLSAAAATLVLVAGFMLWNPYRHPGAPAVDPDAQLMSDVARDVESVWPHGMPPVAGHARLAPADASTDSRLFEEIESDLNVAGPRAAAPLRGLYSEGD